MERPEFTSKKMNRSWLIHSLYKGALKATHKKKKKKINSLHTTEFLEMFDIIIIIAIIKTVHKDVSQFLPVI